MGMATSKIIRQEGENKKIMRLSGLINYRGKTIDQLTEDECKEARQYIFRLTGTSYYTNII